MKISMIAFVASTLAFSAAYADSNTLYITQLGSSQHASVSTTGVNNFVSANQNGYKETASIIQYGAGNKATTYQGQPASGGLEFSTANNELSVIQTGNSNQVVSHNIGNTDSESFAQQGISNTAIASTQGNNSSLKTVQVGGSDVINVSMLGNGNKVSVAQEQGVANRATVSVK